MKRHLIFSGTFYLLCLLGSLGTGSVGAAPPPEGQPAPDFTLSSDTGENLRLSEFRGQVIMLNFWATWCGPCRQEMPMLDKLYQQYSRNGFVLLGVNIDDNVANAVDMAKKIGISFPVLFDTDKRVSRRYDVDAMPSTLFIDRDGRLRHVHRGYKPGYEKRYQAQIRELLKE
jgi:peroxiredoxin